MSRKILYLIVFIYSLMLMWIEWQYAQNGLRPYVTDIQGGVFWYGIHTTLNMALLWGTALLYLVSLQCIQPNQESKFVYFAISQVILFAYLGLDDRFMLHEYQGEILGRNDAYILLGLGVLQLYFLVRWGELHQKPPIALLYLGLGAILFAVMIYIDARLPARMEFRLALEEISKFWATLFLFLFAWEVLMQKIQVLKQSK
jgi:hypothetical protein